MKLYTLFANGHVTDSYGISIYLIGIYDDEKLAEEAKLSCINNGFYCWILETELNESHFLRPEFPDLEDEDGYFKDFCNDLHVGGYIE